VRDLDPLGALPAIRQLPERQRSLSRVHWRRNGHFAHGYRLQNCGLTDQAIVLHHGFTMFFSLA
jgi:hypothetical protein